MNAPTNQQGADPGQPAAGLDLDDLFEALFQADRDFKTAEDHSEAEEEAYQRRIALKRAIVKRAALSTPSQGAQAGQGEEGAGYVYEVWGGDGCESYASHGLYTNRKDAVAACLKARDENTDPGYKIEVLDRLVKGSASSSPQRAFGQIRGRIIEIILTETDAHQHEAEKAATNILYALDAALLGEAPPTKEAEQSPDLNLYREENRHLTDSKAAPGATVQPQAPTTQNQESK